MRISLCAEPGLSTMTSRWTGADGGAAIAASSGISGAPSAQVPNVSDAICPNSSAPMSPDAISVAFDGRYKPRVKHLDRVDGELPQRLFGAERHVRVRMRAVHHLHEGAIGNRGRHVANLHEPGQPELADAIEVGDVQPRANHAIGEQRQRLRREFRKRRHREHRRVGGDVGFEVRADAGERGVHVDRRQVAGPFVHHVAGDGGKPFEPLEIGSRADGQHAA